MITLGLTLVACSDKEHYTDAIPKRSPAVASIDIARYKGIDSNHFLNLLFHIGSGVSGSGIDLSRRLYAFESPEGNYGLCAAVADDGDLTQLLTKHGYRVADYRDVHYCTLGDSWLVAFSSQSLLVMGPVTPEGQRAMLRTMADYLAQDEDKGLRASRVYHRLDSIDATIAMVTQLSSLPEKMALPLTVAAPAEADLSQLYYAAGITTTADAVCMEGEIYAYNKALDAQISGNVKRLQPIQGRLTPYADSHNMATVFANARDSRLIDLLYGNKSFNLMLTGATDFVDIRRLMQGFHGDVMIGMPAGIEKGGAVQMLATDCDADILAGLSTRIRPCGMAPDKTFYCGIAYPGQQTAHSWANRINGSRLGIVVGLGSLTQGYSIPLLENIQKFLGNKQTLVYTIR